jgi:hypothetical protein
MRVVLKTSRLLRLMPLLPAAMLGRRGWAIVAVA